MKKLEGDSRSVAISVLISLIMILAYHVVLQGMAIFCEPAPPPAAPSGPGMGGPGGPGMMGGPGMGGMGGMRPGFGGGAENREAQLELLGEEVKLNQTIAAETEAAFKSGQASAAAVQKAKIEAAKSQLKLFRAESGARVRGIAAADLALDLVAAEAAAAEVASGVQNGRAKAINAARAQLEVNRLRQQLLRNRAAATEEFKSALAAWQKAPSEAALKALVEAEGAGRPQF